MRCGKTAAGAARAEWPRHWTAVSDERMSSGGGQWQVTSGGWQKWQVASDKSQSATRGYVISSPAGLGSAVCCHRKRACPTGRAACIVSRIKDKDMTTRTVFLLTAQPQRPSCTAGRPLAYPQPPPPPRSFPLSSPTSLLSPAYPPSRPCVSPLPPTTTTQPSLPHHA